VYGMDSVVNSGFFICYLASACFHYTVKKVNVFPVPSRDVINQTLPGRE
jgi:hypothetical protein